MVRAPQVVGSFFRSEYGRSWGSGFAFPWGTPGMGLLLLPLGIGLCLAFAGPYKRWSQLLIWSSLTGLLVGMLNSIRMSFVPMTLWQLGVYVAMIGIGGGLMFKGLEGSDDEIQRPKRNPFSDNPETNGPGYMDVLKGLAELRKKVSQMDERQLY